MFNVLLNDYPVASAETMERAMRKIGSPKDGIWVIEDQWERQVFKTDKYVEPERIDFLDEEEEY